MKEKTAAGPYPLKSDPVRRADVRAAFLMAIRSHTVGVFEQTPAKGAPWADLARTAFEVRARNHAAELLTGWPPHGSVAEGKAAVDRAVAAGCDDPLIVYWGVIKNGERNDPNSAAFRDAVERLYTSRYPAIRRINGVINWLLAVTPRPQGHPLRQDLNMWEGRFWETFTEAARERELVVDEQLMTLAGLWRQYARNEGRPQDEVLADLDRRLSRAGARDYLRLTIRGTWHVLAGWEARGTGPAAGVTEAAWETFRTRLGQARELLAEAMEADPDGFTAPTTMLRVCMGLNPGRREMEAVFQRAMAANPDNRMACWAKLEILHPKWQGSRDGNDYLMFAWALALHPGDGPQPLAAMDNLIGNRPVFGPRFEATRKTAEAFYSSPAVWGLVQTASERILAAAPTDNHFRNIYARLASVAGRTDIAREQYSRIGDNFAPRVFADRAEYDRFRREAGAIPP